MLTFILFVFALFVLIVIGAVFIALGGSVFMVLFGDAIIFVLIIYWIIRRIVKRRRRSK